MTLPRRCRTLSMSGQPCTSRNAVTTSTSERSKLDPTDTPHPMDYLAGIDHDEWTLFGINLTHCLIRIYKVDKEHYDMHEREVMMAFDRMSSGTKEAAVKFAEMKIALDRLTKVVEDMETQANYTKIFVDN